MNESNLKAGYFIKHILSSEWIPAKYISDNGQYIEFLIEDTDSISFEKDDKIVYSVKSKHKNYTYNTVVSDIDFPTYDKITITLKKPLERRSYSRFNVNLPSTISTNNDSMACSVVDISKNGFKIITDEDLTIKNFIDLNIQINDNENISAKCNIIYKSFNCDYLDNHKFVYGLKISSLDLSDKNLLKDFVESLS